MTETIEEVYVEITSKVEITVERLRAILEQEGLVWQVADYNKRKKDFVWREPKDLPCEEWHADEECDVRVNGSKDASFQIVKYHMHPEYTPEAGWGYGPMFGIFFNKQRIALCSEGRRDISSIIERELNADPNAPLFIIWEEVDPSIRGFYGAESYKTIFFIGREDKAMESWNQARNTRRYAGSGDTSYSYPRLLKEEEKGLKTGHKIVLRQARQLSEEELWEIEQGY